MGSWQFELTPNYAKQLSLRNLDVKKSEPIGPKKAPANENKKTTALPRLRLEAHIANYLNSIDLIKNSIEDHKKQFRSGSDREYVSP